LNIAWVILYVNTYFVTSNGLEYHLPLAPNRARGYTSGTKNS